ncbi:FMN-linked oxidoreductase [Paxillus ammoniavirescens]|nr:FMN-linked oxidoreductase [Paxillus ammoniavirescens]
MSRREMSTSPTPESGRAAKRPRVEHLTSESFKNGVFLAPMVRSGALPTRLMALKHGATLVWGPEVVDKAILHAERVVDPLTGVVSYNGKSRAIFTTHPVEKPYLIYQIGSASPELAVQAAKTVVQDVSGIDLNCGCPKPFSTHAGMGAALLTNPDLLCDILTALRGELPPEVTVSAKIRLLPTQAETKKLVERIVRTGVSALTVHCRTRNMRPREAALIERLREIVDFVQGLGVDIAVVENGDCQGWEDAKRIKKLTGASSVMVATAAESNPTCFSSTPLMDLETTLIPSYLRMSKYLDNHWALTKFCISQFKAPRTERSKSEAHEYKTKIIAAKGYDDLTELVGDGSGEADFANIVSAIQSRRPRRLIIEDSAVELDASASNANYSSDEDPSLYTPPDRPNPEPPASCAPLGPSTILRMPLPALITGSDAITPSPTPKAVTP